MDWALEELLQEPGPAAIMETMEDNGGDYIDQLHEMLNKQQQHESLFDLAAADDPLHKLNNNKDDLVPVLSPPEGYRDASSDEGSMTEFCPDQEESSQRQQLQEQQHLPLQLPGQQDSGPQANFPYHYQQHRDEASIRSSSTCDAKGTNNASSNDLKTTTPILSSLLAADPITRQQKKSTFPGLNSGYFEHDSGIESMDSLSPKDLVDNTPLNSPSEVVLAPQQTSNTEGSILTSLLSAPPSKEPTSSLSQSMLSTLLTCTTKPVKMNEVAKVMAIMPTLVLLNQEASPEVKVESNNLVSLTDFLDGCVRVGQESTTNEIRSTLEDLEVMEENQKTTNWTSIRDLEVPAKHDEFDYVMCQSAGKVVPEWDTDLNYRLQQLDNVLASAKIQNAKKAKPVQINKRYSCPSCDATFNSCGARNSHRRKVHERFHLCQQCDMAFGSAQKLERHMKTHSGIKEFKCETCGKEFMIERNLVLHYKLHLGQKDYICSICHRTYYTKSGLQAHMRQLHAPAPKELPGGFSCKQCLIKCATRYDLAMHRKQVHAGDVLGEKCPLCPMSFRTATELKRHKISAHSNRPYPCPHCPHRSKTKDKLDRHLLCHSGPRSSFQCQHCEKKFVFKNSLKKHLEKGRCDVLKQKKKLLQPTPEVDGKLGLEVRNESTLKTHFPVTS